jgi:hypothetical protein
MALAVVQDTASPSHGRRCQDVRQVVESLHRRNPHASEDRLAELLVDDTLDDRDLLRDSGSITTATCRRGRRKLPDSNCPARP